MKVSTIFFYLAGATSATAIPATVKRYYPVNDPNVPKIDDPNFIARIINAHWYWRKIHCAQDLVWDAELAKAALASVNACTKEPQHDRGGSNLSSVSSPPDSYEGWLETARTIVHGWHEEETKYPYDNPHYEGAWGHFSQLVWRDTSRIGCAFAHCPDDRPWPARLYCFYENAGNYIDEFEQNVWGMICPDPTNIRHYKASNH